MSDLKATWMNMQHSLIQEFKLYEFKLGHNTTEATKKISGEEGDGALDHTSVIRWFKTIKQGKVGLKSWILRSSFKTEANSVRSAQRVSGEHQHLTFHCGLSPSQP